jgi:hypothetical protein
MNLKKYYRAAAFWALAVSLGAFPALAQAADDIADPDIDAETPAFSSPEAAMRAAEHARRAAFSDNTLETALRDVEQARDRLDRAMAANDAPAAAAARSGLAAAEEAYTQTLADLSGVSSSDIAAMHDSGMGWGMIAHELGVQPGLLGLGHVLGKQHHGDMRDTAPDIRGIDRRELTEATARNMESGWSMGHGTGIHSGVHDSGSGLASGHAMESHGRGGDHDNDSADGISGAGGLGHGDDAAGSASGGMGGDHGSSGGSDHGSDHGSTGGIGGDSGSMGGASSSGSHDSAGVDGSPGGSSSDHGGSSSGGSSGGSSDHGGDSEGHGDSGGRGR